MFTPTIYRHNETKELFTCIQYQGLRHEIRNLRKVTPGRGPYKGQTVDEIFTGSGKLVIVVPGDWIVEDEKKKQWVYKDFQFRNLFTQFATDNSDLNVLLQTAIGGNETY